MAAEINVKFVDKIIRVTRGAYICSLVYMIFLAMSETISNKLAIWVYFGVFLSLYILNFVIGFIKKIKKLKYLRIKVVIEYIAVTLASCIFGKTMMEFVLFNVYQMFYLIEFAILNEEMRDDSSMFKDLLIAVPSIIHLLVYMVRNVPDKWMFFAIFPPIIQAICFYILVDYLVRKIRVYDRRLSRVYHQNISLREANAKMLEMQEKVKKVNNEINYQKIMIQDMSRRDGLTGIYNRVYFNEMYSKLCTEAKAKNTSLTVALFDIDKFKSVNDTYGHLVGDEVIKMVAGIDNDYAERNHGYAFRFGGEEFLLVLPGKTMEDSKQILTDLHRSIKSREVVLDDVKLNVDVCIGYSSYPEVCDDAKLLVARADEAMYYGKTHGRGIMTADTGKTIEADSTEKADKPDKSDKK